jgi:hypothetical protein
MVTRVEWDLKRELLIRDKPFMLTIGPERLEDRAPPVHPPWTVLTLRTETAWPQKPTPCATHPALARH